jgi:hypothetical protein
LSALATVLSEDTVGGNIRINLATIPKNAEKRRPTYLFAFIGTQYIFYLANAWNMARTNLSNNSLLLETTKLVRLFVSIFVTLHVRKVFVLAIQMC